MENLNDQFLLPNTLPLKILIFFTSTITLISSYITIHYKPFINTFNDYLIILSIFNFLLIFILQIFLIIYHLYIKKLPKFIIYTIYLLLLILTLNIILYFCYSKVFKLFFDQMFLVLKIKKNKGFIEKYLITLIFMFFTNTFSREYQLSYDFKYLFVSIFFMFWEVFSFLDFNFMFNEWIYLIFISVRVFYGLFCLFGSKQSCRECLDWSFFLEGLYMFVGYSILGIRIVLENGNIKTIKNS